MCVCVRACGRAGESPRKSAPRRALIFFLSLSLLFTLYGAASSAPPRPPPAAAAAPAVQEAGWSIRTMASGAERGGRVWKGRESGACCIALTVLRLASSATARPLAALHTHRSGGHECRGVGGRPWCLPEEGAGEVREVRGHLLRGSLRREADSVVCLPPSSPSFTRVFRSAPFSFLPPPRPFLHHGVRLFLFFPVCNGRWIEARATTAPGGRPWPRRQGGGPPGVRRGTSIGPAAPTAAAPAPRRATAQPHQGPATASAYLQSREL